jgi:tetratricopeptide (TPR) repeat protein
MRQTQNWAVSLMMALSLAMSLLLPGLAVAETCATWVAQIVSVQGSVEVYRTGATEWRPVQLHEIFCPGDRLRVQEHSRAALVLRNDTNLRLDQNTTLIFTGTTQARTSLLDLLLGTIYFFSHRPRSLHINTPFVNAGMEGTEFLVTVTRSQTSLSIFEGRITAANEAGSLTLAGGQGAVAVEGQAPASYPVVRPRDEVQWALYYPPIFDDRPDDFQGEVPWQVALRQSIQFYRQGDLPRAFASLAEVPEDIPDARFFTYRAGLWLTVGRLEVARVDIDRALQRDPHHSHALALQASIAVVGNRRQEALQLARQAVELAPMSTVARVALSYAQQAHFDLQSALASLQKAVQLAPNNALAWARLAELWLSVGELKHAVAAAQKPVDLQPNLARTHTVLGFALLTQLKTQEAKEAFAKAIELEQVAPLPRLGLGLVQIRQGDLQAGRRKIEIAVSLDPDNALMRSYLGKAYFEEKRETLATDQFAMAKRLDPFDPTPWFYDALLKQTLNRPVEALQDLQKSIALNDNRAVYRSRLLLDADLAARSASLARIYTDLGFQQLALARLYPIM